MKELIKELLKKLKEYLEINIQTKRNMRKRIYQLEDQIKEATKNEQYAIDQMNKYKKKLREKKKKVV